MPDGKTQDAVTNAGKVAWTDRRIRLLTCPKTGDEEFEVIQVELKTHPK